MITVCTVGATNQNRQWVGTKNMDSGAHDSKKAINARVVYYMRSAFRRTDTVAGAQGNNTIGLWRLTRSPADVMFLYFCVLDQVEYYVQWWPVVFGRNLTRASLGRRHIEGQRI